MSSKTGRLLVIGNGPIRFYCEKMADFAATWSWGRGKQNYGVRNDDNLYPLQALDRFFFVLLALPIR